MSYVDMVRRSGAMHAAFTAVARIPKPVVAAVNGYALGGGFELALCADLRFAAEDAVVGQPEVLLGVMPGAGGTQRLTRLIGPSKAKDIIFTGRFVKADEALALGMVDQVFPADRGLRRGGRLGGAVRRRRVVRTPRGQADHRPRPRDRPRDRSGDRAAAVRGTVRHRGPRHRHALLRRERPRQSAVRRPLTRLGGTLVPASPEPRGASVADDNTDTTPRPSRSPSGAPPRRQGQGRRRLRPPPARAAGLAGLRAGRAVPRCRRAAHRPGGLHQPATTW